MFIYIYIHLYHINTMIVKIHYYYHYSLIISFWGLPKPCNSGKIILIINILRR